MNYCYVPLKVFRLIGWITFMPYENRSFVSQETYLEMKMIERKNNTKIKNIQDEGDERDLDKNMK